MHAVCPVQLTFLDLLIPIIRSDIPRHYESLIMQFSKSTITLCKFGSNIIFRLNAYFIEVYTTADPNCRS